MNEVGCMFVDSGAGAERAYFFFSSRRRHTRCSRDWSSDVCSSDLSLLKLPHAPRPATPQQERAALKHLYQLYNQQGITSIGEKDAGTNAIDMFREDRKSVV